MIKTFKRYLAMLLAVALLVSGGVTAFAADSSTGETVLYAAKADSLTVTTFAQFKSAVEAGTPVQLGGDITATGNVGSTSKYINADITIYGNGYTLDMGKHLFLLKGSHNLLVTDLTIQTAASNNTHRYGLFCLADGSATGRNDVWSSQFHNLTFYGSALLGTYNTDDYTSTSRMFGSAAFTGDTNISITSPFGAHMAVVYAQNITISDNFVMKDDIQGKNTGATNPTYQYYFKSPGTGGVSSEVDNNVAKGSFVVADGASVTITRSPGQGTDGATSAYYKSLICGYADYSFGENATFFAKAGTNLTTSSDLKYRSAVIRSNNANSFVVKKGADVKLETDLFNYTDSAAKNGSYGFTALSLKKSGNLEILVDRDATLDIHADGRNTTPSYGVRAEAPVVIWGSGSSSTTVYGNLKVYSENGNGWYYAYSTSNAGKAAFTVESTGQVEIVANNLGVKGAEEYAAFEAYGKYDVDITVRDGGKMSVISNGYRGMSLAGSGGYNNKNILVTGAGSELEISGVHWAIAAETQPILSITAEKGGKIDLHTTGDVGDGYGNSGSAPSTVYSVGPTTYKVDGEDSEISVRGIGGTYSTIFHDGYGPLKIHVTDNGTMEVRNRNSGTDTSARRAAITAQSTDQGPYGSYDNEILVDGPGSSLTVNNENPFTHGNGGDTGLYPTGAVSFNSSARGNIRVSNGADFVAVSSSLAPTIHLFQGKITFDKPGTFEIRNNSLSTSTGNNNSYATFGQAVYNARMRNGQSYLTSIEFVDSTVTVWPLLGNDNGFAEEDIENKWVDVSFAANNKDIAVLDKDGLGGKTNLALNQFDLSAYGRINGTGDPVEPPAVSAVPAINDVYEGNEEVTGTGIAGAEVTVTLPSGAEKTVVVDAEGLWTVTAGEDLVEGQEIFAYQTELEKLPSDQVSTIVLKKPMQQSAPPEIDEVYEDDAEVTGNGIAGAEVTVIFPSGAEVTATVDGDGAWTVPVNEELAEGQVIYAYQTEPEKLPSDRVSTIVLKKVMQKSAPPEIDAVYEGDDEVYGTGIAGSEITVTFPGGAEETAFVDEDGDWYVESPVYLAEGDVIRAYQTEPEKLPSDEVSVVVLEAAEVGVSEKPSFKTVREGAKTVSGYGVSGAEITVLFPDGEETTTVVDGEWKVNVPGSVYRFDTIYARQTESGKLPSDWASTIVLNRQ